MSWFNPKPRDLSVRLPRQLPKKVVPSYIGEDGQVLNLLMHHGSGGVVKDYSGFRNYGTIIGATWRDGSFGWALDFGGVGYVRVPTVASLQTFTKRTVLTWAYLLPNDGVYHYIQDNGYWISPYGDLILLHNATNQVYIQHRNTLNVVVVGVIPYTPNKWHQVGYSWDGVNLSPVYDGTFLAAVAAGGTLACSAYDLFIGSRSTLIQFLRERLTLHRIYNRDLSLAEVRHHFESTRAIFGV